MRILVLDDEKYRHDCFANNLAGHEVWHVYTARDGLYALQQRKYDMVCLDYDLVDEKRPGRLVAQRIADMPESERPETVLIHSWNPPGAQEMAAILRGKVKSIHVIPFQPSQVFTFTED